MITSSRVEAVSPEARPRVDLHEEVRSHFQSLLSRLPWLPGESSADDALASGAKPRGLRTLGLTSCYRGEGVSTVAAQLAVAAAQSGDVRVLLVDANPARPAVHRMFGAASGPGWSDVLREETDLETALQPIDAPHLFVLAAGTSPGASRRRDESARCRYAVEELRNEFDLVVFDLPPAGDAGADRLAAMLDGVLLVIEAERVRWQAALRTKEHLLRGDARLLGAVLNKRQQHVPRWLYQTL